MPKRHTLHSGDWESIFGRLQELVLANSGEDEFSEIFKILVAKIHDETSSEKRIFKRRESPEKTASAINDLIAEAADRWRGIISGKPQSKLRPEHLEVCIEEIQNLELSDSSLEVLDNLFEHLISRSAKGSKGQYFTPRHVIDCCAKLTDPSPDDVIVDPACGSGGFLIHALQHVSENHPSLNASDYAESNLWGFDYDERTVGVAKALMLIASGAEQTNIFRLNSLLRPGGNRTLFSNGSDSRMTIEDVIRSQKSNFNGFDTVLTNPPFAGEIKESNVLESYDLGKGKKRTERDILFLERCIDLMRPGGKLCIVLPHNKVGSKSWSEVREWLIRHLRTVAVLDLGRNTFLPHTHQKTSVVFGIKRDKPIKKRDFPDEEILFLISEKSGKDSKGKIVQKNNSDSGDPAWIRADHDLNEVLPPFHSFVENNQINWS